MPQYATQSSDDLGGATSGETLTDGELQSEIELVGELVVAATSSSGPLPQDQIDRLLGIEPGQAVAHTPVPEREPDERSPSCASP